MTANILATELAVLVQESKRKNADIRTAAEKSLADLKSLPNTSETQLASDLRRRPHFVQPFVLSCASKNPRFVGPSIGCLQRLVASSALHQDALKDVLEAVRESSSLSQDIQLKILQLLPSLLQNYSDLVVDDLLIIALHTCFALLANKNGIVSNTAAATLQQVVVTVFDRVAREDGINSQDALIQDVSTETGWVSVRRGALDAHRLLNDICLLVDGQKPEFLSITSLHANFGLEMVETILSHHAKIVVAHPELVHILRLKLLPFIIRTLSEKAPFSTTVRAVRVLPAVLSHMLGALAPECEMALSLVNHILDPEAGVSWKRVLCMELLRTIYQDSDLVRRIFEQFDKEESRRNIIQDQLAALVRIASEKPSIIGLGQQSSVPYSSGQAEDDAAEMAALQSEGISGTIGVAMTVKSSTAHGISTKLSTMKIPCLEQVDKTDPPAIPPSYLYSLALTCMNHFSEGLAKFLLPFTVPGEFRTRRRVQTRESERRSSPAKLERTDSNSSRSGLTRSGSHSSSRVPANPLQLSDHPQYSDIKLACAMVESSWPALLAAYSTYFHAALDSEYYRGLVRSFQKFTQVSGLLRLDTPRDAFLTTLSKNAMPSGPLSFLNNMGVDSRPSTGRASFSKDDDTSTDHSEEPSRSAKSSLETSRASLNARNLLCLRALLNLGIALGPVLVRGWTIVLEALQQADFLINHITSHRRKSRGGSGPADDADILGDIGNEIAAVAAAATRMLESSADLLDQAYIDMISSLCGLFRDIDEDILIASGAQIGDRRKLAGPKKSTQAHDSRLNLFVIDQITKVVKYNGERILEQPAEKNGWEVMAQSLQNVVKTPYLDRQVRYRAAKTLLSLISITASPEVSQEIQDSLRLRGLREIRSYVEGLYDKTYVDKNAKATDEELHWLALEALRSVLELYGDSLTSGWDEVFAIVTSVFQNAVDEDHINVSETREVITCRSAKLMRSSFGSLQLICSDFMTSLPDTCLNSLMHAVHAFTDQQEDLNISLTATTLYSNVADLHWRNQSELHLDEAFSARDELPEVADPSAIAATISLRLFRLLVNCSTDTRTEVRHGAIYSLFRILEAHAEKFSPSDWLGWLNDILIMLLAQNQKAYEKSIGNHSTDSGVQNGWNETATLLLENTSTLLGLRISLIQHESRFSKIWEDVLSYMSSMIARKSLAVSAAVFLSLEKIFSANQGAGLEKLVNPAWDLWLKGNPVDHLESTRKITDNQPALLGYLSCFLQLQQLSNDTVSEERLRSTIGQIELCVTGSSPTAYAGDIDTLTPLQVEVLECIKSLKSDTPGTFPLVLRSLAYLVTLPFEVETTAQRKGPTFVALSKTSMAFLADRVADRKDTDALYTSGTLVLALQALDKATSLKYAWSPEGKAPPPWRKATTATLQILNSTLSTVTIANNAQDAFDLIWPTVLASFASTISTADGPNTAKPCPDDDLQFDITSARAVFNLIVPALGAARLTDELRRKFASILFEHSFIHDPHPDDLPLSYQEPLAGLFDEHIGRTNDLPPSPRARMSYTILCMLFELVCAHDGSSERIKLAQAAAPYLILRTSLSLKAYISDQPLRGAMPQPHSQRMELLWILRKLIELNSEPRAIPDTTGVASRHKKHLFRMAPLIQRALRVARRDGAVHQALERVLEMLTGEFGV